MTRNYRPWLDQEVQYVLANRDRRKLSAIARHLGRSRASVSSMLVRYEHSKKKTARTQWESVLRKLHAQELTDREIARHMKTARSTASRRRIQLGLLANPYHGRKVAYRKAMRTAEANSLVDLRYRPKRVAALLNGTG